MPVVKPLMHLPRILCIFASTLGLHIASTSPNPPLLDSERVIAKTVMESMWASHHLRVMQKGFYWSLAIAETAAILAQVAPPSMWAEKILSILAFGGDLSKVHVVVTPTIALGSALITCGAVIRLHCYHVLGPQFTFETGIKKNHKLITTGPYSIVRHPGYSGAFLAYAGLMFYFTSPGSWVMECAIKGSTAGSAFGALYALLMLLVITGLTWRIPHEDKALRCEFGEEWEKYAAEVRYRLMPGVW